MSYMDTYKKWCTDNYFDEDTKKELLALQGNDAEIEDRFTVSWSLVLVVCAG